VGREESLVVDLNQFAAAVTNNQSSHGGSTAIETSMFNPSIPDVEMQDLSLSRQGANMPSVHQSAHYECNPIFLDDIHSQIVVIKRIEIRNTKIVNQKKHKNENRHVSNFLLN
jgi:hypothetical protein